MSKYTTYEVSYRVRGERICGHPHTWGMTVSATDRHDALVIIARYEEVSVNDIINPNFLSERN